MNEIYFEVVSKLNKKIRITKPYWNLIITMKHPPMKGKEEQIKDALIDPDEIRQSVKDPAVHLYYKAHGKYFAAVVCKHLNDEGHIITAYITDRIKEGVAIWKKQ